MDNEWQVFLKNLSEGLGCLLISIGIAVIIWALAGFPGLH